MQLIKNICGIIISVYSLYYQFMFVIFNNLTRNSQTAYYNVFLQETLPQLLIVFICLIFLFLNVRGLVLSIMRK
jgi:hypothetical protein